MISPGRGQVFLALPNYFCVPLWQKTEQYEKNGNMPKIFNGYVNFKITDREQPISVTFPQAFSEIPSVIGMVKRSGYANQTFWTLTAVNKTSATFYVTTGGNTANNADCTLYWIAAGR